VQFKTRRLPPYNIAALYLSGMIVFGSGALELLRDKKPPTVN
jgi:hypothetical protein